MAPVIIAKNRMVLYNNISIHLENCTPDEFYKHGPVRNFLLCIELSNEYGFIPQYKVT